MTSFSFTPPIRETDFKNHLQAVTFTPRLKANGEEEIKSLLRFAPGIADYALLDEKATVLSESPLLAYVIGHEFDKFISHKVDLLFNRLKADSEAYRLTGPL